MTTVWQTRLETIATRVVGALGSWGAFMARPEPLRALQRVLLVVLALWIGFSFWRGLWSFFPEAPTLPVTELINPAMGALASDSRRENVVDIEALIAAHLFGQPGAAPVVPSDAGAAATGRAPTMSEDEAALALAGIEDGAPETRLPLILRGVVASSEAGLGQAVIELRKAQDLYQVGDELPVQGEVVLAKVLPDRVVLDNGGRFELLRLFEDSALSQQVPRREPAVISRAPEPQGISDAGEADDADESAYQDVAALAAGYRDRLYSDPQSLADVIRVTAVREDTQLVGYRISPGTAVREFSALGFQAGDIVTAVNGLSLTDPSNTVRLFEDMRSVREASFELQRKGEQVYLNVNIAQAATEN